MDGRAAAQDPGHASVDGSYDFRIILEYGGSGVDRRIREVTLCISSCPGAKVVWIHVLGLLGEIFGLGGILKEDQAYRARGSTVTKSAQIFYSSNISLEG